MSVRRGNAADSPDGSASWLRNVDVWSGALLSVDDAGLRDGSRDGSIARPGSSEMHDTEGGSAYQDHSDGRHYEQIECRMPCRRESLLRLVQMFQEGGVESRLSLGRCWLGVLCVHDSPIIG